MLGSCVNNRWEVPTKEDVKEQKEDDTITIIKYTF
jgi:hypothetical protein